MYFILLLKKKSADYLFNPSFGLKSKHLLEGKTIPSLTGKCQWFHRMCFGTVLCLVLCSPTVHTQDFPSFPCLASPHSLLS